MKVLQLYKSKSKAGKLVERMMYSLNKNMKGTWQCQESICRPVSLKSYLLPRSNDILRGEADSTLSQFDIHPLSKETVIKLVILRKAF